MEEAEQEPAVVDGEVKETFPGAESPLESVREIMAERKEQGAMQEPGGRTLVCQLYQEENGRIVVESAIPSAVLEHIVHQAYVLVNRHATVAAILKTVGLEKGKGRIVVPGR